VTRRNAWCYRHSYDVARGPAPVPTLRDAGVHGLNNGITLVWVHGLVDFVLIKHIRCLIEEHLEPDSPDSDTGWRASHCLLALPPNTILFLASWSCSARLKRVTQKYQAWNVCAAGMASHLAHFRVHHATLTEQ
jgi:hypothetical protein